MGHETDFTIADWVADVRAPTPSAAAEIAIAEKANLLKFLSQTEAFLQQRVRQQLADKRQKLLGLQKHPFLSSPLTLLSPYIQRIDDLQSDLQNSLEQQIAHHKLNLTSFAKQLALLEPTQKIAQWKARLAAYPDKLSSAMQLMLRQKEEQLQRLVSHLRSIHPRQLLQQGYAILFDAKSNAVIRSTQELFPQQTIRAMLHDGKLAATVDTIEYDPRNTSL